jgi:vancomycin aglycone glucosyltransferase
VIGGADVRITLVACGSRGDVQPMMALALGLRDAGHDVLLCAPPEFETWVGSCSCPYHPLGAGFRNNPAMARASLRAFGRFIKQELTTEIRELPDVVRGSALVLATGLVYGVPTVAEFLHIPYRLVAFCPATTLGTSRDPLSIRLGGWLMRLALNAGYRRAVNRERSAIGLPPVRDVLRNWGGDRPIAATDAALTYVPEGATLNAVQTGYMHLRESGAMSPELEAFLDSGSPPVYVGFGSAPAVDPEKLGRLLAEVARSLQLRLVIARGWSRLDALAGGTGCLVVDDVPHPQLFPRVAAVVHHGGAGTVATAARAGVPQVVLPVMSDQFQWQSQVVKLGLGPPAGILRFVSAKKLSGAISECLSNPRYRERAREVSRALQGTNGVELTVKVVEQQLAATR